MKMLKLTILLATVLLMLGGTLNARQQTGEITGTVLASDGTAMPGVLVEAQGNVPGGKRVTVTLESGQFRFLNLSPGTYDLTFSQPGFNTVKWAAVSLHTGQVAKLEAVKMEAGKLETAVQVKNKTIITDPRNDLAVKRLSKELLSKLPRGRTAHSVLPLAAGLNAEAIFNTGDGNNFSINGSTASENVFYVDGAETTLRYGGAAGTRVHIDLVEDIQTVTSGMMPEYAGGTGGVVNITTRSGGDELHGFVSAYFEGSWLGNNETPTLIQNPFTDFNPEYVTFDKDDWSLMEPGFGIGGTLSKDKVWFYLSFVPSFRTTTRGTESSFIPGGTIFQGDPHVSGADEFTRKDTWYTGMLRLNGKFMDQIRISATGSIDYRKWEGALPGRTGYASRTTDYEEKGFKFPNFNLGTTVDFTLGNTLDLSATVGYVRADAKQLDTPRGPYIMFGTTNYDIVPEDSTIPRLPAYWRNFDYGEMYKLYQQLETRFEVGADAAYHAENLMGNHSFKAGFRFVRLGIRKNNTVTSDYYRFLWERDYINSQGTTVPTTYGYVEVIEPLGTLAQADSNQLSVYLQDSWTLGRKLTLNLGVRFEKDEIPTLGGGSETPITFGFADKWAPRAGFVYDVYGDAGLKVSGSFGVYFDSPKVDMAEAHFGGMTYVSHFYDLTSLDWENDFPETSHPVIDGFTGGTYLESLNRLPVSYDIVQPDLKPYRKYEYSFAVRKQLGPDWTVALRGLHNTVTNVIEDVTVRNADGDEEIFIGNPGSEWLQNKLNDSIAAGVLPMGATFSKPVRRYTSVSLSLDRGFKDNWLGGLSYTWSRLEGNYSGLASTDMGGARVPNASRYYDQWYLNYDQKGQEDIGPLMTDRPHQFKLYGAYSFDFGLTLGLNALAMSGTPLQTEIFLNGYQGYYPEGRGSNGRTDMLWRVDLFAEYTLKLTDRFRLSVNLNVTNLTDNEIAQRVFMLYNSSSVYLTDTEIMQGFDYAQVIDGQYVNKDARYGMAYDYMASLAARLGIKLTF